MRDDSEIKAGAACVEATSRSHSGGWQATHAGLVGYSPPISAAVTSSCHAKWLRRAFTGFLLLAGLAFASCGNEPLPAEQQVREAAERNLSGQRDGNSGEFCSTYVTVTDGLEHYDDDELVEAEQDTAATCERQFAREQESSAGRFIGSYAIDEITVSGPEATVKFTAERGGQTFRRVLRFTEVRDGDWRIVVVVS